VTAYYRMYNGIWRLVSGTPGQPPPPVTEAPGGIWGTAPRAGTITDLSGVNPRTTQYNHASAYVSPADDGKRWNAGLGGARTIWTTTSDYAITGLGKARFNMWRGGTVIGQSPVDGTHPWDDGTAGGFHDQTAMRVENNSPDLTIEYFCPRRKGDLIGFAGSDEPGTTARFVIRWCSCEEAMDNALSNDAKMSGINYQSFFSGASLYESRPDAGSEASDFPGQNTAVEWDGCALWLRGERYSDMSPWNDTTNFGVPVVLTAFKMQQDVLAPLNVRLKFRNSMFRYDGEPKALRAGGNGITFSIPSGVVTEWTNVGICFPGRNRSQGVPANWPAIGTPGITHYFNDDSGNDLLGIPRSNLAHSNWNRFMEALQVKGGSDMIINDPGTFAGV
jgi:hypothetical protein